MFENRRYDEVAMLETHKHLARNGALLNNYYAVAHPSGPNYRAMASGATWKPYETINEFHPTISNAFDPPVPVYTYHLAGKIAARHNPFQDLRTRVARVEYGMDKLVRDLDPGSETALPERCIVYVGWGDGHNMHWGTTYDIETGDRNLSALIAALGRSRWFTKRDRNGRYPALFFSYDEDERDRRPDTRVFACWWGVAVKPGYESNRHYTHYSFCRTVTDNYWGSGHPLEFAAGEKPIKDVWRF